MSILPWTIYVSLAGALLAVLAGRRSAAAARAVALATALLSWALVAVAASGFEPRDSLQTIVDLPWITSLGIHYHLAADGISMTFLMLTGLASTAGILFSWNIEERAGEFFGFFLMLIAGVYGVFLSADVFLFFVFYELAIVPKYFLVAVWGSTNREYAAMKLVLYSFGGSALVLGGMIWAYAASGATSFGIAELAQATQALPAGTQAALFALVFTGFAVLAGLFPFHTWAPTGHVAAPTGASMLLAGVVMKLGADGCLRVAMPLFPLGLAHWHPFIGWLAVVGIVYAGFIALIQDDCKFVVGYSSVSHMGFVMLGLAAATPKALSGAVLQMFSHGVIAGLLFAVVGRMVYERMHTRKLSDLGRVPLARLMPFAAVVFVVAGLASMGLPGFSGFPAELLILVGTWSSSRVWALLAVLGVLVAAAFTLRVVAGSFFGSVGSKEVDHAVPHASVAPITWAEVVGSLLLLATTLLIGLRPDLILDWVVPSLHSPLFRAVVSGGAA